jgi:Uma2 family endonuclease
MVTATPQPDLIGEKRIVFSGLSWSAYQQILQSLPQQRTARLTYDGDRLEITMPLEDHEFFMRLMERFIVALIFETGQKLKTLGSTTIARPDLARGTEPGGAYYIQNQPRVAGRPVNFTSDPPPDLVVEVDVTHSDIDKNRLYASLGVPEFWRFDGREWRIFCLNNDAYQEVDHSPTFPWVEKGDLYHFLAQARLDEIEAERAWRSRVREHHATLNP